MLYEILQLLKDSRTEMIVHRDPVASFKAQSRAFAQEMTYLCIGTNKHNLTILCTVQLNIKSLYWAPNVGVACWSRRRYGCGIMRHHYTPEMNWTYVHSVSQQLISCVCKGIFCLLLFFYLSRLNTWNGDILFCKSLKMLMKAWQMEKHYRKFHWRTFRPDSRCWHVQREKRHSRSFLLVF